MLRSALISCAFLAWIAVPASAAELDRVSLNVLAAPVTQMRWTPTGNAVRDIPLCITSESGGFLLDIVALASGAGSDQKLVVQLTDPAGGADSAIIRSGSQATLQGTVDLSEDCRAGANARVRVSLDRADVLAGVAGDVSFMLNFAVRSR